uniref:Uncharacterized protein n=1 Tax=Anopheles darlingi TaxID=43151 RepID=A0A2M4D5F5_ANODA
MAFYDSLTSARLVLRRSASLLLFFFFFFIRFLVSVLIRIGHFVLYSTHIRTGPLFHTSSSSLSLFLALFLPSFLILVH